MIESFIIAIGFNLLMFMPAFYFKTDRLTDLSYVLTFIFISTYLFFKNITSISFVYTLLYLMIVTWALRLGVYLFYRIHKFGRDRRFDEMRASFWKFLRFWLLQGITVFIVLIPSVFVLRLSTLHFRFLSLVGVLIFLFGLIYESLADLQKFNFLMKNKKNSSFLKDGLWSYSRHPNYFGEICVWLGIYIYCICYIDMFLTLVGVISPFFIFLLLRYVSGIPLLEKSAALKYKRNKKYEKYLETTPLLIPHFWKRKK